MAGINDIVITGIGCITPLGIGREAFLAGLSAGKSAIRRMYVLDDSPRTAFFGAAVDDFDGKQYVTPRKALKVMSREIQMAYSAAHLAWQDAKLTEAVVDPERMGVVYGSEMTPGNEQELSSTVLACSTNGQLDSSQWGVEFTRCIYPLWMLKYLPNMPACHVGIAIDARGPNNTIAQDEVGSLLALSEASAIIERDQADLMVVGGIGSRVTATRLTYRARQLYHQHPLDETLELTAHAAAFDADRRGIVPSEGACALILERRSHAVRRRATILARLCGSSSRCAKPSSQYAGSRTSIAAAAKGALQAAGIQPSDLNHVCAQGYSNSQLDIEESQAIRQLLGDIPVTAASSYFGTAGAACGLLELTASLLGLGQGKAWPTLGHRNTDRACPINVCTELSQARRSHFLKLSFTPNGQAAAAVLECEN